MSLVTYSGKVFDYKNINKESIDINDIIHSLPRLNRFVGHSSRAYSVGEHSYYCYLMAKKLGYTERVQKLVLIHDFTETYVGDCPSPLKNLLPEFSIIEEYVEKAILNYLGLDDITPEEFHQVKRIDMTMLVLEMMYLTHHNHENFISDYTYIQFIDDMDFDLTRYMDEDTVREKLRDSYSELFGKSGLKKFDVYSSINGESFAFTDCIEFESEEDALAYAKEVAEGIYGLNPDRDILEIAKEEGVDHDTAEAIFMEELKSKIIYSVKEVS